MKKADERKGRRRGRWVYQERDIKEKQQVEEGRYDRRDGHNKEGGKKATNDSLILI